MLKSENVYVVETKSINHVIRRADGKEFDLKTLYLKEETGKITAVVVNDYIYEKATNGNKYKLKAILTDNGKLSLNDIELQK